MYNYSLIKGQVLVNTCNGKKILRVSHSNPFNNDIEIKGNTIFNDIEIQGNTLSRDLSRGLSGIYYILIYLSIYLSTYLSINLSIYLSTYLSINLSIYPFI
jgi:hypothetical protein